MTYPALSPVEYRSVLADLRLTHEKAAERFGIGVRTSKTYSKEGVPEGLQSMAFRLLLREIKPDQPANMAGSQVSTAAAQTATAVEAVSAQPTADAIAAVREEVKAQFVELRADMAAREAARAEEEAARDAARKKEDDEREKEEAKLLKKLLRGLEAYLAEREAAGPYKPLDEADWNEIYDPPHHGERTPSADRAGSKKSKKGRKAKQEPK